MDELYKFNTLFDDIKYGQQINDETFTEIYNDYNNEINKLKRNNDRGYLELIRANINNNFNKIVKTFNTKNISIYKFINGDSTEYTHYNLVSKSLINPNPPVKEPLLIINYTYHGQTKKFKISDDDDKVSFILILLADQYRSLNQCINALSNVGGKNKKRRTQKKRKNKKKV